MKKIVSRYIFKYIFLFSLLFIFTFPLNFEGFLFLSKWNEVTNFFTENIVAFIGDSILHLDKNHTQKLLSDSTALYIYVGFLLIFSFVVAIVWQLIENYFPKNKINYPNSYSKLNYWFCVLLRYYLALVLLQYGFAKIFQVQFYTPEPNTLYTPLGFLSKDILYWSVVGSSHFYNIFTGSLEVLAAILLLFRKTYLLGSIFSMGILVHIIAINFGFDISVKVFSSFLFLLSFILVFPYLKTIFQFFVQQKTVSLQSIKIFYSTKKAQRVYYFLKMSVLLWLVFVSFYPYYFTSIFYQKPSLYGAYKVIENSLYKTDSTPKHNFKRIFIHSKGYLITQDYEDNFEDYRMDNVENKIIIYGFLDKNNSSKTVFEYRIIENQEGKFVEFISNKNEIILKIKVMDLQKLPLLQDDFEWIID